jgi:hypothetical protein
MDGYVSAADAFMNLCTVRLVPDVVIGTSIRRPSSANVDSLDAVPLRRAIVI